MQIFETFISYRRSETLAEVQNIYHSLLNKGLSTFCDIYSLNNGRFDEGLKHYIDTCTNYILVLGERSLDRCVNDDDWLRFEIKEALDKKKNIICVFVGDFSFPKELPEDIDNIRFFNGIKYDFSYFNGFIDCLTSRFLTTSSQTTVSDATRDFVIIDNTVVKYVGTAPIVSIPEGVTSIAEGAFKDQTKITELNLPSTITKIMASAFERCINLTHVSLPTSLKSINKKAFFRCYNLSFVAFNDSLEEIGEEAFGFCTKIKTVNLGKDISIIDSSAFNNCNKLSYFFVSDENQYFSAIDGILYDKNKTKLIRCPEGYDCDLVNVYHSVEVLSPWCFSRCINIVDIILPRCLKKVLAFAFNDCHNLLSLTLGDEISEFDVSALNGWNESQRVVVSKRFNPLLKYNIDQKILEQVHTPETNSLDSEYVIIKTTFESREEAAEMAKMLLNNKYIASAQLSNLNVFYTWNNEFSNEDEVELSCITRGALYPKVEAFIKTHHSYECCQMLCIPVSNTSIEFGEWIKSQTI